jgi:hypothetical protein
MLPELLLSNIAQAYILPVLDAQGFRSLSSTEQEKLLQPLIEGAVIRIVAGISQHFHLTTHSIYQLNHFCNYLQQNIFTQF